MERKSIEELLEIVRNIEQQLVQVRVTLEQARNAETVGVTRRRQPARRAKVSDEELEEIKKVYSDLRERFVKEGRRVVDEFVEEKSVAFLDRLILTNDLPIPTRRSKQETVEELVNYLARSVLLRGT
ncbi:MAG: hypothetical protein FJ317_02230 [SAR202 cluster bacterium]|nr:hypothetical protein [SAR202 cluster bacterium]